MKLYQVEYMLAVCKYGSISKAAAELMVSRQAVSRALRELEAEFGLVMFARTTGGIELTEIGALFHEKCRQIIEMVGNLSAEMQHIKASLQSERASLLRIGLSPLACSDYFPDFFVDFNDSHPDILMETKEILGAQIAEQLNNNELDVGMILCLRADNDLMIEDPGYIDLRTYQLFFACSASHRLAGRQFIEEEDILAEQYVDLDRSMLYWSGEFGIPSLISFRPNVKFQTRQLSMVMRMVKTGHFCSLRFRSADGGAFTEDGVVYIPFKNPIFSPLRLVWSNAIPHNLAFHSLITYFNSQHSG